MYKYILFKRSAAKQMLLAASVLITCTSAIPGNRFDLIKSWLKQEDNYMYHLTVTSRMKTHPEQAMVQRCVIYNSKSSFIRYMQSDERCFFASRDAIVRTNSKDKMVLYSEITNDSLWRQYQHELDAYWSEVKADSILFWKAEAGCQSKGNDILRFQVKHPAQSAIKSMQVDYNVKSKMVEVFDYTIERAMADDQDRNAMVIQQVHAEGYQHAMPQELQHLIKNASHIRSYLEVTYPGYTIRKSN